MYERLDDCPICKSTKLRNKIICKDYLVSKESFAIVECSDCGFLFTNPRPDKDHIADYYKSKDYISHTNKANNLINIIYKTARIFTSREKYKLISQTVKNGKILDIGCGTGTMLKHCKNKGWDVTGIEPDSNARQEAIESGLPNIYSSLENLNDKDQFDVITLWHVLEHLPDLNDTMSRIKKLLKPEGHLIIALPNANSWDSNKYGENWAAYDVPRHFYHFTKHTFKLLSKKHKLKITDTQPMPLDAFYISLLSEKNLNGKGNLLEAFTNGLKSNKWAKENDSNYSSIIYVLTK